MKKEILYQELLDYVAETKKGSEIGKQTIEESLNIFAQSIYKILKEKSPRNPEDKILRINTGLSVIEVKYVGDLLVDDNGIEKTFKDTCDVTIEPVSEILQMVQPDEMREFIKSKKR